MTENRSGLKGTVTVGRLVKTAAYETARVEMSQEFYLSEETHDKVTEYLRTAVDSELRTYLKEIVGGAKR